MAFSFLAACAPVQQAGLQPTGIVRPGFSGEWFTSFDGAKLGLTTWRPAQPLGEDGADPNLVIVAIHGMNDYAGAFNAAGKWWASQGVTVYAYDQRSFGRSPGWMIWPEPELMRRDLKTAVEIARRENPGARVAVVGESMGAAVAATAFAEPDPPPADALILSGPGFRGWGDLPAAYSLSLWVSAHVRPGWIVVPPKGVHIIATDNNDKLREMWNDPHVQKANRIDSVYGVVSIMEDADKAVAKLPPDVPTLMLYGAHDQVIPPAGVKRAVRNLPPHVRTAYYAKGYHMLMNDRQARTVWQDILAFAEDPAAPLPSKAPPIPWVPSRPAAAQVAEGQRAPAGR
jgi:alpha-beta hydrolase superfamily lysophospholipase